MSSLAPDAIVIGSGPNGLAAAITLAQAGLFVLVLEGAPAPGGGCRSEVSTLPGFVHDNCAGVMALVESSLFFRSLPLARLGVELIRPPAAFAHPLDDGTCALVEPSVRSTADALGPDARAYFDLFQPLVETWNELAEDILAPAHIPRHPLSLLRFGWSAMRSARSLAESRFTSQPARALFAGVASHSMIPLDQLLSAALGMVLTLSAHAHGWPIVRGGSGKLTDALLSYFQSLGGEIRTNTPVRNLDQLPPARVVLCDITPRQLLAIAGHRLPTDYRSRLERYRYGPGAFKIDWALDGPIPWRAAGCATASTVHLGGTLEEIAAAEAAPWLGRHAPRPFALLFQPALFDPTRAPAGRHTARAYCHVPNGSTTDMTQAVEDQVERFAPGFQSRIVGRHTQRAIELEQSNPNLVGGDVGGGANTLRQLFARPVMSLNPYATPLPGLYLCSSSTPPGGGVHGMCGYWAARAAIDYLRRATPPPLPGSAPRPQQDP